MNPGLSGYCRHTGSRFQRCCDQLLLLRETPAPPPLNRCNDLNLPIRHVIIPVNTHMTHNLTRAARRPLADGYPYVELDIRLTRDANCLSLPISPRTRARGS